MTTIVEEEPYAAVVGGPHIFKFCSRCFNCAETLKCMRCHSVSYCSKPCQRKDWVDHKAECGIVSSVKCSNEELICTRYARILKVPLDVRLALRIYQKWKIRGELGQCDFNGKTIDDVPHHVERLSEDAEFRERFEKFYSKLAEVVVKIECPPREAMKLIYAKMTVSSRAMEDDFLEVIGAGLYVGLSAHDTSCSAQVFVVSSGRRAVMRSPETHLRYTPRINIYPSFCPLDEQFIGWLDMRTNLLCSCDSCRLQEPYKRSAPCPEPTCNGVCPFYEDRELECDKCGRTSRSTPQQVMEASRRIALMLDSIPANRPKENVDVELEPDEVGSWLTAAHIEFARSRPHLSNVNMTLGRLARHIYATSFIRAAMKLSHGDHHTSIFSECMKRYLPRGHPMRAYSIKCLATAFSMLDKGLCPRQLLSFHNEALTEVHLAFGADHSTTKWCAATVNQLDMRCGGIRTIFDGGIPRTGFYPGDFGFGCQ